MRDETLLDPTDDVLRALCAARPGPRVTIQLPLLPGPPTSQNVLRMRQAVQLAEKKLDAPGAAVGSSNPLTPGLASLVGLAERHATDRGTLACFVNAEGARCFLVAGAMPERVAVSSVFALRPFLRARALETSFHLLALSVNRLALYAGDARTLDELSRGELPASLEDALGSETSEKQLRMRGTSAGGGAPVFYSHDARSDERTRDFARYRHVVARALEQRLRGDERPLVLAADARHVAGLRDELHLPALLEAAVNANPDTMSPAQLHARAWPLVEAALVARDAEARDSFERARNTGKGLDLPQDVASAAASGRVHRLWLDAEASLPGALDEGTGRIGSAIGDDDVLDQLAVLVVRHGGEVRAIPSSAMPSATGVAAELR